MYTPTSHPSLRAAHTLVREARPSSDGAPLARNSSEQGARGGDPLAWWDPACDVGGVGLASEGRDGAALVVPVVDGP